VSSANAELNFSLIRDTSDIPGLPYKTIPTQCSANAGGKHLLNKLQGLLEVVYQSKLSMLKLARDTEKYNSTIQQRAKKPLPSL